MLQTTAAPTTVGIQGLPTPPAATALPLAAPPVTHSLLEVREVVPGVFCSVVGATHVCDRYGQTGSSYRGDEPPWRRV
jgi:hypothetical protein